MDSLFKNQKKLGIVGEGPDANNFIMRANALGFFTNQLCKKEKSKKYSKADQVFVGSLLDNKIIEKFIMKSDLLVYFDRTIDLNALETAQKSLLIPQGENLLAIAQDRSLQKAFYESIGVNISPYQMIVKKEEIQEAIAGIGYPAVLRSNFIREDEILDSYFIYNEEDIEKASKLLQDGPAILESWITAEHYLSITVIKLGNGKVQFYPIVKKHYKNERLMKIMPFSSKNMELKNELKKAAKLIVEGISFQGALTLDFIVSPAEALYLGDLYPYPTSLSRYSEGDSRYSSLEAHLRAINSLPVAEIKENKVNYSYHPIYADQKKDIDLFFLENPEAQFYFYPWIKNESVSIDDEIGYYLIENDSEIK